MKFGIIVFPGSNCDQDCLYVLRDVLKQSAVRLWHQSTDLHGCEAVVLPGGFSYGDYLRTGAIARLSPVMDAVSAFAKDGGLVLGICNGFQILLETGLLPGVMSRNTSLRFICRFVNLRVERTDTPFTNRCVEGQILRLPIAHNEGNYTVDEQTLKSIQANRPVDSSQASEASRGTRSGFRPTGKARGTSQVVFRYCDAQGQLTDAANPNGSIDAIAGLCNPAGNVLGLMPHPERSAEPALGSSDGRLIFESMIQSLTHA